MIYIHRLIYLTSIGLFVSSWSTNSRDTLSSAPLALHFLRLYIKLRVLFVPTSTQSPGEAADSQSVPSKVNALLNMNLEIRWKKYGMNYICICVEVVLYNCNQHTAKSFVTLFQKGGAAPFRSSDVLAFFLLIFTNMFKWFRNIYSKSVVRLSSKPC